MPAAIGGGHVDVSFHPVSSLGGVSFDDSKMPRFVASNDPVMVVEIDDCITTLLFPFVTNRAGFDTGLAITNTSEGDGSCAIEYSGSVMTGMGDMMMTSDAPADLMSDPVEGGGQWIAVLSRIAPGFQGYITATCGFRDAYGFAFLTDGFGGEQRPPRRRAISRFARIATKTKKTHRAAAPRVRKEPYARDQKPWGSPVPSGSP